MRYVLIAYERAHDAMEAAGAVGEGGVVGAALIPRPRTLTAGCGVALRIVGEEAAKALAILAAKQLVGDVYVSDDGKQWCPASANAIAAGQAGAS
jgi:hypothetical protein